MSRSPRQPTPLDWQPLLLEAIQHRDAPQAVPLAQRCVHRHGMAALETLLERADAGSGQRGEARTWLLAQLRQGCVEPVSRSLPSHPPESASSPSAPLAEPPASCVDPVEAELNPPQPLEQEAVLAAVGAPSSPAPSLWENAFVDQSPRADESVLADQADLLVGEAASADDDTLPRETDATVEAGAPLQLSLTDEAVFAAEEADLPAEGACLPAVEAPVAVAASAAESVSAREVAPTETMDFADTTVSVVEAVSLQAAAVSTDHSVADEAAPDRSTAPVASASAALDLAFAPLEIAFPPLPLPAVEQREAREPLTSPTPTEEPPSPLSTAISEPSPSEGAEDSLSSAAADGGIVLPVEREHLFEPFEARTAAPVPTFQVDAPPEQEPLARRKKRQPDEPKDPPAPVAKALEGWRAWLPGAFRSRNRS